jgi:EAL domain-containing protein (putative c-di-GMP-specific phosphodiesterase class I)
MVDSASSMRTLSVSSSSSYLSRFPLDALKIDRSFVPRHHRRSRRCHNRQRNDRRGKSLKQRVIAEGVETREKLDFLQTQGCGEGQSCYFSRPVVAEHFTELLGSGIAQTDSING